MSKSSDAPPPLDPYQTAAAQGLENRRTARYNNNLLHGNSTINPFGKTSWSNAPTFDQAAYDRALAEFKPAAAGGVTDLNFGGNVGDNPQLTDGYSASGAAPAQGPSKEDYWMDNWTNKQELSPESQGVYDQASGKLVDAMGNVSTDADAYNQQVSDAIYNRMRRYQDDADAQARSSMQSNLADRGFQVGNEGYNNEMTRLDEAQGRGRADAADTAVIQGMEQGRAQLSAQQQIANFLQNMRGAQVSGVSGMPTTLGGTPSTQPVNIAGLITQSHEDAVNQANADAASQNGLLGSLLSLGGMALGSPWLGEAFGFGKKKTPLSGSGFYNENY